MRPVPSRDPPAVVMVGADERPDSPGGADDAELEGRQVEGEEGVRRQHDPDDRVADEPRVGGERQRGQPGSAVGPAHALDDVAPAARVR